jgi:hypothetical protein
MIEEKRPNYKIYHFGKNHYDKIVDDRFYAENDNDAYTYLQAFINTSKDDVKRYYATIHYSSIVDEDGNKTEEFDIDDMKNVVMYRKTSFIKRVGMHIADFLRYWLIDKPRDFRYKIHDLMYLIKNGEEYSCRWNIDQHIIDTLEKNIPHLIKNSHSLMFLDEAILKMHENEKDFDLTKYHIYNCGVYPKEVEDLAIKMQNEEYSKLLQYIKLYKYYSSYGDFNEDDPDEVAFDKEWRHTLPIKLGTYDEISDYSKIDNLVKDSWNKIWDWMKLYGYKLND